MFIPLREFGRYGMVTDYPYHNMPVGAWSDGRNVKFNGQVAQRALEPKQVSQKMPLEELIWMEQFWDGTSSRVIAASTTNIFLWDPVGETWDLIGGPYSPGVQWQSFSWGKSVLFNNGVDTPVVYNGDTGLMVDLPHWGVTASGTVPVAARAIIPYKTFLVALNLEIDGASYPNTVWWSDAAIGPELWTTNDAPNWNYELASSLSGQNQIGLEDGPLQWGAGLGEGMVLYTTTSSHSMLFSGGPLVFDFRRLFNHGCAGIYCAAEFDNFHLVVDARTIYIHDGNSVKQAAEDRVKETFFNALYSAGGGGSLSRFNLGAATTEGNPFASIRMAVNPPSREVYILYTEKDEDIPHPDGWKVPNPEWTEGGGEDDFVRRLTKTALVYNYEDDNWAFIDASVEKDATFQPGGAGEYKERTLVPCSCMTFGLGLATGNTWASWEADGTKWSDLGATPWSALGETVATTELYWLCTDGIYLANTNSPTDLVLKKVFVEKEDIDLGEIDPAMTSNRWNHMRQMYPHIEGDGIVDIEVGWSSNLTTRAVYEDDGKAEFNLDLQDPDAKVDIRTTGRYLALKFTFNRCGQWKMTGCDADIVPLHGR